MVDIRWRAAILASGLSLVVTACAGAPSAAPAATAQTGQAVGLATTATIVAPAAPSHLDRQVYTGTGGIVAQLLNYNVTETLLRLEPDGKLVGLLAERWEITAPGTIRFHLRTGVTFSDGAPWNAEAARMNIERAIALKGGAAANEFPTVTKATAAGEYVLDVSHKPDPLLPKRFAIVAQMYSPKQIKESEASIKTAPIGTGPYRVTAFDPALGLELALRDGYWGEKTFGKPSLTAVKILFRPEAGTRTAMLKASEADLVLDLLPDDARSLDSSQVARLEGFATHWLRFGLKDPVTGDVRVRQAIDLAIDRKQFVDLFSGYGDAPAGYQLWPSWVPGWTPQPVLTPDLERAKKLVQEAGAVGKEISLVAGTGRWPLSGEIAELAGAMIAKTGLKVNVRKVAQDEYRVILRDVGKPREIVWSTMQFDVGVLTENLPQRLSCTSSSSQSTYCSQEFDTLTAAIDAEADPQKRAALVQRLTAILQKDLPAIGLVTPQVLYGKSAKLQFAPIPGGLLAFSNFKLAK